MKRPRTGPAGARHGSDGGGSRRRHRRRLLLSLAVGRRRRPARGRDRRAAPVRPTTRSWRASARWPRSTIRGRSRPSTRSADDRLRVGADGHAYIWNVEDPRRSATRHRAVVSPEPRPLKEVEVSNEIRRVATAGARAAPAGLARAAAVRLAAAEELSKSGSPEAAALLHRALGTEQDRKVRDALALAVARVDLASSATGRAHRGARGDRQERQRRVSSPSCSRLDRQDAGRRARRARRRACGPPRPGALTSVVSHQRLVGFVGRPAARPVARERAAVRGARAGRHLRPARASSTWPTARC